MSNARRHSPVIMVALAMAIPCLGEGTATAVEGREGPPTHFDTDGGVIHRTLDEDVLVVRFRDALEASDQLAIVAGAGVPGIAVEAVGKRPTTVVLRLATPTSGPRDAYERITMLLESSEVLFASPLFQDPAGYVSPLDRIILEIRHENEWETPEDVVRSLAPDLEIETPGAFGEPTVFILRSGLRNGFDVLARSNALALDPQVEWAEPNCMAAGRQEVIPDDDLFDELWGLENTGQEEGRDHLDMMLVEGWDITTGSSDVRVLILDTGVQLNHPDLNVAGGRDFRNPDGTNEPNDGNPENANEIHGTAVAGCVSALMNGVGVVGVAPGCPILSGRFAENTTCGSFSFQFDDLCATLDWGRQQGARVSVSSFSIPYSVSVDYFYQITMKSGMVHFAAAGNDAVAQVDYPARSNHVNAVSAVDRFGGLAPFSNYGNPVNPIQFAAPGNEIWTTDRSGSDGYCPNAYCNGDCLSDSGVESDYVLHSGTSFAAPYAAGVAALVLSRDPSLDAGQVQYVLRCTARDLGEMGRDDLFGWGMPVAYTALSFPVRRVNVRSDLTAVSDWGAQSPSISGNGRFVAFQSRSDALDYPNGTGGLDDVFVHDRSTGLTSAVSWRPWGPSGPSSDPDISWDGRHVAFTTSAYDNNGLYDVYVMDRDYDENGVFDEYGQCDAFWCGYHLVQVSENVSAGDANGGSFNPSISGDARYVAFESDATDLVAGDTNGLTDIFVRDLEVGNTVRVSVTTTGAQANGPSVNAVISAAGRYVAFTSRATNLVAGDTNGFADVYVHDRDVSGDGVFDETGDVATFRASWTQSGAEPNWDSEAQSVAISTANGHLLVAYATGAWNMGSNDMNMEYDIYLYDADAGTTMLMSETSSGQSGNLGSFGSQLSDDGQFLVMSSLASDLVSGDGNGRMDVFLRRLSTGGIALVSVDENGVQGNDASSEPTISLDGTFVAYTSLATNLIADDANGLQDVFVLEGAPTEAPRILIQPQSVEVQDGDQLVLEVEAEGTPPPGYQWRYNTVEIPGATFAAYIIDAVTPDDDGAYDVVVTNRVGSVISETAMVHVVPTAVGELPGAQPGANLRPILASHPNPIRTRAVLTFTVPGPGKTELRVMDVAGRSVRSLVDGGLPSGAHVVEWDGRLATGNRAASGVYYLVLRTGGMETRQRVTLVR